MVPVSKVLKINSLHGLGRIHFAIPHHADWHIIPSIQKVKVMRVKINYNRPRIYFWNDTTNSENYIDSKSFRPQVEIVYDKTLYAPDQWYLPNSSFEYRGQGPKPFLLASGLKNHSRLILDGKTVVDKNPAVSNASMYISANELAPIYFFIHSQMHHLLSEPFFIMETGYYKTLLKIIVN